MESDFLSRVGLCLNPHHPASRSIVVKALRSMKPDAARNPRDRELRTAKGMKILRSAENIGPVPMDSVVPGLGIKSTAPEEQHPILIDANHFDLIASKMVRGIYYLRDGLFIEPTHVIDHFLLDSDVAREMLATFGSGGETFVREPCLRIRRFVATEDRLHSLFEIELWQQLRLYASVELASTYSSRKSAGANS
jgi:hypothetical protein